MNESTTLKSQDTASRMDKILVSKREAASALSVSVRTIENYIRLKELPARKIGRRTLIPVAALEAFARRDHESPIATYYYADANR